MTYERVGQKPTGSGKGVPAQRVLFDEHFVARDDPRLATHTPITDPFVLGSVKLRFHHLDAWSRLPPEEAVASKLVPLLEQAKQNKAAIPAEKADEMRANIRAAMPDIQRAVAELGPSPGRPLCIRVKVAVIAPSGQMMPDPQNGSPFAMMLLLAKL